MANKRNRADKPAVVETFSLINLTFIGLPDEYLSLATDEEKHDYTEEVLRRMLPNADTAITAHANGYGENLLFVFWSAYLNLHGPLIQDYILDIIQDTRERLIKDSTLL